MREFSIIEDNHYVNLIAPIKVYFDLTSKCNLNCEFCFNDKTISNELSWEEIKIIIDKIIDAGIFDIVFIGGEPLASECFVDALKYAYDKGLNVGIVTNGTMFSQDIVSILKKYVGNSISVSLHAPSNELHDIISGGIHVYDRIINGLELLNNNGIVPEISFTPEKRNVHQLFATIDSILERGIHISDILVNRLIPSGNALTCWTEKSIDYQDQIVLFDQMILLQEKYPNLSIGTGDAIPFCMFEEKYRKFILRCDYAITLGWINYKAQFGKCMCRESSGQELSTIWDNEIQEIWKNSTVFTSYRNMEYIPVQCKKCNWLLECGGGCACSSCNVDQKIDSFFDPSTMKDMPSKARHFDTSAKNESVYIKGSDCFSLISPIVFRQEKEIYDIFTDKYLAVPYSMGATIRDNIIPEVGIMFWTSEIEKSIILRLTGKFDVRTIRRMIQMEYNIELSTVCEVIDGVIYSLLHYNMVKKHECV